MALPLKNPVEFLLSVHYDEISMSDKSIDLVKLSEDIKLATKEGKDIVINDDADKAVAAVKLAEKQIEEAIDLIREAAKEALEPLNAKTMRGKFVTITVSAPRKVNEYSVDDEASSEFSVTQKKVIPNKEAIDKFIEDNDGRLPIGIHRNELKQSVSIKLKQSAIDDYENEQETIES